MILADTSVWVNHFRRGDATLQECLLNCQIVMHPAVLGEIACGNLRARASILSDLRRLPPSLEASHDEVLSLVDQHHLFGKGIGWVDAHLLASARLSGCQLWTRDNVLSQLAARLGVGYPRA